MKQLSTSPSSMLWTIHLALLSVPFPHPESPHSSVVERVVQSKTSVTLTTLDRKPPHFVHVFSFILTGRMTGNRLLSPIQIGETCKAPRS